MKNYLLLSMILSAFIFFSCKKQFTCECVETYDGKNEQWTKTKEQVFDKMSQKDAEIKCDGFDQEPQVIFEETLYFECGLKE